MNVPLTAIQATDTFLPDDSLQARCHAFLASLAASYVSPRLDRDVGVCDAGRRQLTDRTKYEAVSRSDLSPLLQQLLQLLEDGVLQDRVDHQDQCREHAGEEAQETLLTHNLEEGRDRVRSPLLLSRRRVALGTGEGRVIRLLFTSCHTGVHHPDRIGDHDSRTAGKSAGRHRLNGVQASLVCRPLKECP